MMHVQEVQGMVNNELEESFLNLHCQADVEDIGK